MPNYLECDDVFEDVSKIKFTINPDHPAKNLYIGVSSRYSQPISLKPIYGEFIVPKQRKKKLHYSTRDTLEEQGRKPKPDIFQKANDRLFNKLGDEERAEVIREIMLKKQRKLYELAKGKDYISLNKAQANLFRVENLKRKYVENIVF
jgi:hypothetical protein